MFKLKSAIFTLAVCGAVLGANAAQSDDSAQKAMMVSPKPVDNKVLQAMVGTWVGDSDMMGNKMHDVLKIRWALNHQFIIMDLHATGGTSPKTTYDGMGIFGVSADGKAKSWWFDNWGADSVSTGTGDFSDNKLTLNDSNAKFNETRTFEIKDHQMTMHAKGTMTWQGKQNSFDNTTVYKRK